ncbi:ATP-binding cassette domain-containing protein [Rhizosphaericola mali]|uniref:Cell division ATP-binding protein FtsE n=1 Tax=Rhizosphaericola mali TaxID=2545455 RepID=A0A5P2G527_9BACT|nr:ATP-binding cassette domain-containing protein [Rhizosphaericola mali]
MIQIKNISKQYSKGQKASNDISLNIEKGKIFGIIGSSGAGKSTLLRCLNLLEKPSSGEVWIEDKNILTLSNKELNSVRKQIGMIFQHFNLLASKTVLENIALPLKLAHKSSIERKEIALKLLEKVGLSEKANNFPAQLSGGQKQRVAIARALALSPKILLCDEATSALDPASTVSVLRLLKQINQELGITIVLITHEMQVIKQICDEVAVLSKGNLVEVGAVSEVFLSPKSEETKELLSLADLKL